MNRVVTGSSLPTTVDQLLTGTPALLLWKVDVEGFEPQVLQGVTQALHNPELKAVLLEADSPASSPSAPPPSSAPATTSSGSATCPLCSSAAALLYPCGWDGQACR